MDQVTNTLQPHAVPVPWSCPRSEAVLHRTTNYYRQCGFTAPALLSPRAAGMLTLGKQRPTGEVTENVRRVTLQNQFRLESYP